MIEVVTEEQLRKELEDISRSLGLSTEEAVRKLRSGEFNGTAIEVMIKTRLFLLEEE